MSYSDELRDRLSEINDELSEMRELSPDDYDLGRVEELCEEYEKIERLLEELESSDDPDDDEIPI